ncbi:MAG: DUF559 domain-containing protein [Steroidobacteraceae bacterium]
MRNHLTQQRAITLRKQLTDAEQHLWNCLRHRQMLNVRFRRQMPVGPYIVDFASVKPKLVIELDGGQHAITATYDHVRDSYLAQQGFRVLRFWNNEVLQQREAVLAVIMRTVQELLPPP